MIIYKTTNLLNDKIYIGQDIHNNPKYFGSGKIIVDALRKHGVENFKKEILEYCRDVKHLDEREQYWIKELKSQDRKIGYNITSGGRGMNNETRQKIKEQRALQLFSEETRKKFSVNTTGENNPMFGKGYKISGEKNGRFGGKGTTDDTRQKISAKNKGKTRTLEYKEKCSINTTGENNPMYKKNLLTIWINKYGEELAMQKWMDLNERKSKSNKGRKMTEEHKEKIRKTKLLKSITK